MPSPPPTASLLPATPTLNGSHHCPAHSYIFSDAESLTAGVFAASTAALGSTVNACTIWALLNFSKTRYHSTTPFVISLATSDFVFSSVTLPLLAIKFFVKDWIVGEEKGFFCQIFPLIFYGNSAVTLFSLMSVTIHRWVVVYYPNHSNRIFSRTNSKLVILLCWLLPPLIFIPSLAGLWGHHGLDCHSKSCTFLEDERGRSPKSAVLLCGLFIPCFVLVVTNFMIFTKVKMVRQQMEKEMRRTSSKMPKGLKEREQRLTKMMLFIFGCFLFTYMPGVAIKVTDNDLHYPSIHVASYVVNWFSVIMNPAIYVITQERYRQAFVYLFRGVIIRDKNTANQSFMMSKQRGRDFRSSVSEEGAS